MSYTYLSEAFSIMLSKYPSQNIPKPLHNILEVAQRLMAYEGPDVVTPKTYSEHQTNTCKTWLGYNGSHHYMKEVVV